MTTKICKSCLVEKTLDNFYAHRTTRTKSGYTRAVCKQCHNAKTVEWQKANPEKQAQIKRWTKIRKKYGISKEQYLSLHDSQNSCCAICGIHESKCRRSLDLDHDHETGVVRGLLCEHCNKAIGLLKDSPKLLLTAKQYLERFC